MNVLERFDKLEHDLQKKQCLQVKRCKGRHCIEIKPKEHEHALKQIIKIKDQAREGKFQGLRCDSIYDPNTCYKLRVCIEQHRYHEVLSDEIDKHIEQMKR